MAKPICIFKIDTERLPHFSGLMEINRTLIERMPDYHVFVLPFESKENEDSTKIEVFYEKDFTEIQYSELKSIIDEALKQN